MLKTETLVVTLVADDFNEHIFEFKGSELAVFECPLIAVAKDAAKGE